MSMQRVWSVVDQEQERMIEDLRRLIRQPSISSLGQGVRECAHLLVAMMAEVGVRGEILETEGHPAVYGEIQADRPGAPTLLIYNHYDVQPADPYGEWRHDPFAAVIEGDRIIARGSTDAKGNLMAHLKAIDAYRKAGVPLPINIKFIFDGEEEIGSPSLPALVQNYREKLMADATLSFDGGFDATDKPRIDFGTSGLLKIQLRATGSTRDLHSSRARLVANPAWRLIWALSTMKGPDERILIDGFYDRVIPPTPEERALLEADPWNDAEQMRDLGVTQFLCGVSGTAALERLIYQPTLNINSFKSGYLGEGSKTVLPSKAQVTLDLRLVPDQSPEEIGELVRAHLIKHGFDDIECDVQEGLEAARSPLDSAVVRAVIGAAEETYGDRPIIRPRNEASGRQACWIGAVYGIPGVSSGVGPPAWLGHAPNEFITLRHYLAGIKFAAAIYQRYGG